MSGFDADALARLRRRLEGRVESLAWLVDRDGEVESGTAGCEREAIFRISSMTKPVVAVAALQLVEECLVRLGDPVDEVLPELASPRVLIDPSGPVDGPAVAATRAITLEDLLTFRLGTGMDFEAGWPQPIIEAMDGLGLGGGPPAPSGPPEPDEWMRRFGTLPFLRQPGERWLYNTGAEVLGVLVARVAGKPLDEVVRERVFGPLGMASTGWWTEDVGRLGACWSRDPATGERVVYDPPDGQWTSPPAFPSGGGGLLSTLDDYAAFGRMLRDGGLGPDGARVLSPASVAAMTTDHLVDGATTGSPEPGGALGWGYGMGVRRRRVGIGPGPGSYGWDGGLGSSWVNDPAVGLVGVILTNQMFDGPFPPPTVIQDFWTGTYSALT